MHSFIVMRVACAVQIPKIENSIKLHGQNYRSYGVAHEDMIKTCKVDHEVKGQCHECMQHILSW